MIDYNVYNNNDDDSFYFIYIADNLWSQYLDFNYPQIVNNETQIKDSNGLIQIRSGRSGLNSRISSSSSRSYSGSSGSSSIPKDIFQLQVIRKSSNVPLFNMGIHTPFIYAQGYMELTTMLWNDIVYGLGQSGVSTQFRHNFSIPRTWTLVNQYSNDQTVKNSTMYGSHPFYLGIDDPIKGDAYGVLLVNTYPITVSTNARPSITLQTFGGHFELVS